MSADRTSADVRHAENDYVREEAEGGEKATGADCAAVGLRTSIDEKPAQDQRAEYPLRIRSAFPCKPSVLHRAIQRADAVREEMWHQVFVYAFIMMDGSS